VRSGPDIAAIVHALERHDVEYVVVGGIAAQAYGAQRPTKDFDCLINRTAENLENVAAALRDLNDCVYMGLQMRSQRHCLCNSTGSPSGNWRSPRGEPVPAISICSLTSPPETEAASSMATLSFGRWRSSSMTR
jgi:hypothetical protein